MYTMSLLRVATTYLRAFFIVSDIASFGLSESSVSALLLPDIFPDNLPAKFLALAAKRFPIPAPIFFDNMLSRANFANSACWLTLNSAESGTTY
jgi:hypothetical protein